MKKESKGQGHLIVANGGGVQRTGSGGNVEGNTIGHEVGRASAMVRSLHELEWREKKGEERGFTR